MNAIIKLNTYENFQGLKLEATYTIHKTNTRHQSQ